MRFLQPDTAKRVVFAIAVLISNLGASAPAMAEDVKIVTGPVSAQELADMLFIEQPKTRSIQLTEPERPAIAFMVQFAFDSAEIVPQSRPQLDVLGKMLQIDKVADKTLRIEGHTDSTGSRAYNQLLSERRARAVARYLTDTHGVEASRLVTSGEGEEHPLQGRDPRDDTNRRVQFRAAE